MGVYEGVLKDLCSSDDYDYMRKNELLNEVGYVTYVMFSNYHDSEVEFSFKEKLNQWREIASIDKKWEEEDI